MVKNFRSLQFFIRIWGQLPKESLHHHFTRRWILGATLLLALQLFQLGSQKRPIILKLSFTDFIEFMFNQMNLLFKKSTSKA